MAYNICKYGDGSGGGGDTRPDGSTVTPVSDVPTWLRCGGLGSKGYTTLSQVLDDSTTLDGLMSDANAVNYLVRSTVWVSDITSNSNAMTYIGANDYAAYKLLSNNTWSTSICNSAYMELVLTKKVPNMTSDTTPEGLCFGQDKYGAQHYCNAFEGKGGPNAVHSSNYLSAVDWFIGYMFTSAVKIYITEYVISQAQSLAITFTIKSQGSVDNSIWMNSSVTETLSIPSGSQKISGKILSNSTENQIYHRIYTNGRGVAIWELQFYGRIFGNVQSWLKAGGITNKSYTTLEQVLSDSSTLQALMTSSDAVDYLSACGNWASTICTNQSAMTYIGANNYAANTLLSDSTWLIAIANSQYIESVLNVKVPTMTGYTTPSGEVIYSSVYSATTIYDPWHAFDGNLNTAGLYTKASYGYIGYKFTSSKMIYLARIISHTNIAQGSLGFIIQGSTNKTSWVDLTAYNPLNPSGPSLQYDIPIINRDYYTYYRITNTLTGNGDAAYGIKELQFYGRQDV